MDSPDSDSLLTPVMALEYARHIRRLSSHIRYDYSKDRATAWRDATHVPTTSANGNVGHAMRTSGQRGAAIIIVTAAALAATGPAAVGASTAASNPR